MTETREASRPLRRRRDARGVVEEARRLRTGRRPSFLVSVVPAAATGAATSAAPGRRELLAQCSASAAGAAAATTTATTASATSTSYRQIGAFPIDEVGILGR